MQAMRTANLNIYNKYKSSQLTTPNPDSTLTAANAGQSTPLVDSRFIKTGLGPNGTANTMVTLIDNALLKTKKVINNIVSYPTRRTPSQLRRPFSRTHSRTSSTTHKAAKTPF